MEPLELDADLPPSCRHVAHALQEADRPLTQRELTEVTGSPRSTVKQALKRLVDAGEVQRRSQSGDPKTPLYELADG